MILTKHRCTPLTQALAIIIKSPNDRLAFVGASKCFEVAFEHAWKWFKIKADEAGFEIFAKRDVPEFFYKKGREHREGGEK